MEFFIDHGLVGPAGARIVLQALSENARKKDARERNVLTLSQNELGDNGIRVLAEGLLDLYRAKAHPGMVELNLASNMITDDGFSHLITNLMLPSSPPNQIKPILTTLYLNGNDIKLDETSHVPSLLAAALSHPSSKLQCLSLTHNPGIQLGRFLKNCTPTSLTELHLNVCNLSNDGDLVDWLSDPARGGKITHLQLNGNLLGCSGVLNLINMVDDRRNVSLVGLELAANEDAGDPTSLDIAFHILEHGLTRNKVCRQRLHKMAFRVLYLSRILLLGRQRELSAAEIISQVSLNSEIDFGKLRFFPWLRLPADVQNIVLRWTAIQTTQKIIGPEYNPPFSDGQFLRILTYAAKYDTLQQEVRTERLGLCSKDDILKAMGCFSLATV